MNEESDTVSGFELLPGERLDDLVRGGLKIIQSSSAFCFSMDAVLLANFATVKKGETVIDLGTGTGVIPLLISARSQVNQIIGLEIQKDCCERAQRSIRGNGLENLIQITEGDICNSEELFGTGRFDLVTSNPPYLPVGRGAQNKTGSITIARHEILCDLQGVIQAAGRLVRYGGRVAMVHRPERMAEIFLEMEKKGLKPRRLQMVYPEPEKRPNMVLVEAQLGGNPELIIDEPFFVYDENGRYTKRFWDTYYPGLPYPDAEGGFNDR